MELIMLRATKKNSIPIFNYNKIYISKILTVIRMTCSICVVNLINLPIGNFYCLQMVILYTPVLIHNIHTKF